MKTGHVCPSNIKVHKDSSKITVKYCSTHLWHTNDIGRQRLSVEDRHNVAGSFHYLLHHISIINIWEDIVTESGFFLRNDFF